MKKISAILAALLLVITMTSCGMFGSNYISLSAASLTIDSGSRTQLTATLPSSMSGTAIVWTSSDSSIATVDSDGWVTGVAGGVATVTATAGKVAANCTVTVSGDAPVYSGGNYKTSENADGTLTVTGIEGKQTKLSIPSEIDGKTVTAIADGAFMWDEYVIDVTIPATVKKVGANAFYYCPKLASVTFVTDGDSGVTEIGESAFYRCTALKSVTFPSTVRTIGDYAFEYCKNLNSVELPVKEGSVTIGEKSFLKDPDNGGETRIGYTK